MRTHLNSRACIWPSSPKYRAYGSHHPQGMAQRRVDNMVNLRENGTMGKGEVPSTLKTTFLRELFYSFLYDLFPFSSYLVHKNSTAACIKILVCNHQHLDFIFHIFPTNHNPFACTNYTENFNFLPCLFLPIF